jgi:hypothetical protein
MRSVRGVGGGCKTTTDPGGAESTTIAGGAAPTATGGAVLRTTQPVVRRMIRRVQTQARYGFM